MNKNTANIEQANTNNWILSKYSCFNFDDNTWDTLDSSKCISPITIQITSTCHLVINYENKVQECLNLWNCKETSHGVKKGASLLISHKVKNIIAKFRIKFLPHDKKSAEENCVLCINKLKNYFPISLMDNYDSQSSQQLELTLMDNTLNNTMNVDNVVQTTQNMEENLNNKQNFTHRDVASFLINKYEKQLPLIFLKDETYEGIKNEKDHEILKEYIMYNLLDSRFALFVEDVSFALNDLIYNN